MTDTQATRPWKGALDVEQNVGMASRGRKRTGADARGGKGNDPEPEEIEEDEEYFAPMRATFRLKDPKQRHTKHFKRRKQVIAAEGFDQMPLQNATYVSVEAPPSMYPVKKYCDVTGFPAKYTDPRSKLQYASLDVFPVVRTMAHDDAQKLLALRNAHVSLR